MAYNSETISPSISVTRSQRQQHREQQQQQQQQQKPQRGLRRRHHCLLKMILLIACCCCGLLLPTAALAKGYHDDHGGKDAATPTRSDSKRMEEATAEILELPHAFRHQEHYTHRIEQAVNDFKRAQQQQQQEKEPASSQRNSTLDGQKKREGEGANDSKQQQQQHHRRHEHKIMQQQHKVMQQEPFQQHHLRHHHNGNNNNKHDGILPPLRHQHHQMQRLHQLQQQQQQQQLPLPTTTTTTTESYDDISRVVPHHSSLDNRSDRISVGAGNARRHSISSNSNTLPRNSNVTTKPPRYFDRDGLYRVGKNSMDMWWQHLGRTTEGPWISRASEDKTDSYSRDGGSRRYSLKFPEESDGDQNDSELDYESDEAFGDGDGVDKATVPQNDENDDYSYEDDDNDDFAEDLMKSKKPIADADFGANYEFPSSFSAKAAKASVKRYTNPFLPLASQKDKRTRNANDFTAEKWQRIEHEHYEQKRQREMQARDAAKRQQLANNDEDPAVENIYSRWYIPGTLTRHKQEKLGTPEAVHEERRAHAKQQMQHKALASAHNKHIMMEGSCRIPQRRIERIQRDLSKIYTPHCTILYRCADDTGCCRTERQTCAPKRTQNVDLYFFVKSIDNNKGTIERLTFVNHTECHCVDRVRQSNSNSVDNDGAARQYAAATLTGGMSQLRHATILNCNCPKPYEKILQEDGVCRCDCSSGNTGCDWLKRGQEHFSMIERKCIMEGRCKLPTCEYGHYMKKFGRCPRPAEQMHADDDSETTNSSMMMLATNTLPLQKYH